MYKVYFILQIMRLIYYLIGICELPKNHCFNNIEESMKIIVLLKTLFNVQYKYCVTLVLNLKSFPFVLNLPYSMTFITSILVPHLALCLKPWIQVFLCYHWWQFHLAYHFILLVNGYCNFNFKPMSFPYCQSQFCIHYPDSLILLYVTWIDHSLHLSNFWPSKILKLEVRHRYFLKILSVDSQGWKLVEKQSSYPFKNLYSLTPTNLLNFVFLFPHSISILQLNQRTCLLMWCFPLYYRVLTRSFTWNSSFILSLHSPFSFAIFFSFFLR